jgi:hypothetical protein
MTNDSKIVDLRRGVEPPPAPVTFAPAEDEAPLEAAGSRWPRRFGEAGLAGLALGWLALVGGLVAARPAPSLADVAGLIALAAGPLALIALLWLLLLRGGRAERQRFLRAGEAMRQESDRLERRLAAMNAALAEGARQLAEQSATLETVGARATERFADLAQRLGEESGRIEGSAGRAGETIGTLIRQLEALHATVPGHEERLARLGDSLAAQGERLSDRAVTLEEQLRLAGTLAEEARRQIIDANRSLTGQLGDLRAATGGAAQELTGMAELASTRIDLTLERAQTALDTTRQGLEVQNKALQLMIDRARASLDAMGNEAVAGFTAHSEAIAARLSALETQLDRQREAISAWLDGLGREVGALDARWAALEADGGERHARLSDAVGRLTGEARRMQDVLAGGTGAADQMIGRAEALLLALDSILRELDESMPLALGRMDERFTQSQARIAATAPQIERMEATADGLLSRLQEGDALVTAQTGRLDGLLARGDLGLAAQAQGLSDLHAAFERCSGELDRLGAAAGPTMVEALVRVREAADKAAERAREAILRVVPEAAQALGEATESAFRDAMEQKVTQQLTRVGAVADGAVAAAHRATDRLMRQMLAIADTSADIEKRLADAREVMGTRDADSIGRLSAQLIDALNSAAIDVARLLGADVGEASWTAYLKGERGLFTRQAVRLAGQAEARQILALYQQDDAFREHVGRYIHDFEAMLRGVLSARDGGALAVTLLSSDIGKLYVLLAQAIERLRTAAD